MGVCWRGHDVMAIGWKSHRPSESRSDARHHPNSDNNSTPTAFLYLYMYELLAAVHCDVSGNSEYRYLRLPTARANSHSALPYEQFEQTRQRNIGYSIRNDADICSDTACHQKFSVSMWYIFIFSWCLT